MLDLPTEDQTKEGVDVVHDLEHLVDSVANVTVKEGEDLVGIQAHNRG